MSSKHYLAVFISDLHLNPYEPAITARFHHFIDWAAKNTEVVYILGDFFHVWAGDDGLDSWSRAIAERLHWLSEQGVTLYFMAGNRDFLLGEQFAKLAGMTLLTEPAIIQLVNTKVLLVHGDCYCTEDRAHQWFRRLTRNNWFKAVFLCLPYAWRAYLAQSIRQRSQANRTKSYKEMAIVVPGMLAHMQQCQVTILIHGHIHKASLTKHRHQNQLFEQYVLSDWDDNPTLLCYDKTKRFNFIHI